MLESKWRITGAEWRGCSKKHPVACRTKRNPESMKDSITVQEKDSMATTRNELVNDIKEAIERVLPDNVELDGDNIEDVANAVTDVIDQTNLEDDEEEEGEAPEAAPGVSQR